MGTAEVDMYFIPDNGEPTYKAPACSVDNGPLTIPEDAMYGWLKEMTYTLQAPPSWGYTALLVLITASGVNMSSDNPRGTLYGVLTGPPGDGKSLTMQRALRTLMCPADNIMSTTPGSDKGLYRQFGDGSKSGELPQLKAWCLVLDEMRDMLAKIGIQGSSLPQALCSLWSRDEAGSSDKSGHYRVNIRLSILGALALNDSSEFPKLFGAASQGGMYDRCLFAPGPSTPWKFDHRWQPARSGEPPRQCTNVSVRDFVYDMLDEWREAAPLGIVRKRMGEVALRVALISAAANHDTFVTRECMAAALRFAEWQERVRQTYKAGVAETLEGQCTSAILDAIEAAGVDEEGVPRWVKVSPLSRTKNWHRRYGGSTITRVLAALRAPGGPLIAKYYTREDSKGNEIDDYTKPTGTYRLKGLKDAD